MLARAIITYQPVRAKIGEGRYLKEIDCQGLLYQDVGVFLWVSLEASAQLLNRTLRCDHKNNMIVNQNDSIISEVTVRREGLAYRRSTYREEVQLQFREASSIFLQVLPFHRNPRFRPLLRDFSVKIQLGSRITFERDPNRPSADPLQFIRQVQRLLEGFEVVVVWQKYSCEKSLGKLRESILDVGDEVGSSLVMENVALGKKQLFIFSAKELMKDVMEVVERYRLARQERLVFSLSRFIRKEVKAHNWRPFILKLHQFYSHRLQDLCKDGKSVRKEVSLEVVGVSPAYVSPQNQDITWLKAERWGIYGLQFAVYGQEYQFLRFYSLVEEFFSNLTYVIKHCSDIKQLHYNLPSRFQEMNLKAAVLSEIIVIFDPPLNFQSIIKDLNRRKWNLVPKDFLNLDFQLFVQYKQQYTMKLRSKNGVAFSGMKLETDSVEFQADEPTFKCIKALSRQFLFEMKGEEKKVDFLQCPQDVEFILRYYSGNISYDLRWTHNGALLTCPRKDMDDSYNKIRELYRIMTKNMVSIISSTPITHPLVKCSTIPMQFSYFPSRMYKLQDLILTFRPMYEIYQEKCALFIVSTHDDENEVWKILRRNCEAFKAVYEYDMEEVVTQNQPTLQSIYIIKLTGRDNPSIKTDKLAKMLEAFILRKIPIRVALPSPSSHAFTAMVKILAEHLVFRRSALQSKEVSFFLPNLHLSKHPPDRIMRSISEALQLAGPFTKVCPYTLSEGQVLNGSSLKLVRMRCRIKDSHLDCTSLNSFIFKCELESKRETDCRIGVFLPKSECREYLVCLPTFQISRVVGGEVVLSEVNSPMFNSILQFMRKCFPQQAYTVVYFDVQRHSYLTSLYLYESHSQGRLRRCKMDLAEMTLIQGKEDIPFTLECQREERFLLQTHSMFRKELLGFLEKESGN